MAEVNKILFPLELSSISQSIVPWASLTAQRFEAELHVFHVVPSLDYWAVPYASEHLSAEGDAGLIRTAKRKLAEFCLEQFPLDQQPIQAVVSGRPADEIIDYVKNQGMDLLIMGTHGRKGLERALYGSVMDRVLRLSPVPVFCVHPD